MKEKNISSSELARQTNVPQPVIHRLITGTTKNPHIMTLQPIADFFKVSLDYLCNPNFSNKSNQLDNAMIHTINNRLVTIKTTGSALMDIFPILEDSYRHAVSAKLIDDTISTEIFPLLQFNIGNLLKAAEHISKVLSSSGEQKE